MIYVIWSPFIYLFYLVNIFVYPNKFLYHYLIRIKMSNWSYGTSSRWSSNFSQCSIKNNDKQSPINIRPKDVKLECGSKCQLTIKYRPSKCYLTNDHNTITIRYDPGSYIVYQNNWYELTHAKIHVPSLHSYDGEHYRAEIDLYHCADRQCDTGVVLGIFLDQGPDHGSSVEFLNQFINQSPTNDTFVEREISVSPDWNIISLIPEDRTCYVYEGSLPHPPCTPGWTWIVFNQPVNAGSTIMKTLRHNIVLKVGENIRRPVPLLGNRVIYRIPSDWIRVFEEKPKPKKIKIDTESAKKLIKAPWETDEQINLKKNSYWGDLFDRYRDRIKGFLTFILLVLFIILSIQITKNIIRNDVVNHFLAGSLENNQTNTTNNTFNNPQNGANQGGYQNNTMTTNNIPNNIQNNTGNTPTQ